MYEAQDFRIAGKRLACDREVLLQCILASGFASGNLLSWLVFVNDACKQVQSSRLKALNESVHAHKSHKTIWEFPKIRGP